MSWDYLKSHWYWVVGLLAGLWILTKIVGGGKTTAVGANLTTPTGTSVVYGGTNANDAAVQVAQLNSQTALAQEQIQGNLAVQQAQIAQQANQDTQLANIQIAQIQGAGALAITNSNNAVALRVTDNQTTVGLAKIQADQALGIVQAQAGSAATIAQAQYLSEAQIAQAQASAAVGVAQASSAATVGVAQANSAAAIAIGKQQADLAAYGIQANVVNNQTDALKQIAITQSNNNVAAQLAYLNDQGKALDNQNQIIQDTYNLLAWGKFNKGGEGGTNQVAVWNTLSNPGSAAAGDSASAVVGATQAQNGIAGVIASIGNTFSGAARAVLA